MPAEHQHIAHCLSLIGEKYQLGETDSWKQRDMEFVIEKIHASSGVLISLSTVKRLLKQGYQIPQPTTLNALVSILGFSDWQAFKMEEQLRTEKGTIFKVPILTYIFLGLLATSAVVIAILGLDTSTDSSLIINGDVKFEVDKTVSQGVPNTVIFNYDLSNVEADSFFIQQSWNELEKTPIAQDGEYFTTMYYYPGFHRAKLIANDSIIKRKFIHIKTNGWLATIRKTFPDPIPTYIEKQYPEDLPLVITQQDLEDNFIDIKEDFITTYFNVKEFNGLHSDNFYLNARLKADNIRNSVCPFMQVLIMTEEHIFRIPLVKSGCENQIQVKIGEVIIDGKDNDLSSFGCNVYQWQDLELAVRDREAVVYLNHEKIRRVSYKQNFGEVVGVSVTFTGTGSVDFLDLGAPDLLAGSTEE